MPKQPTFPGLKHAMKKKRTRRELFLLEMEAVVPWGRLLALIAPQYPRAGSKGGRPPHAAGDMSRAGNRSGGSISRRLAAGLLPAELVCFERSHGRRNAV